jgi:hypothetical protein
MSVSEYTLIFGLGPKSGGAPNTDVELAVALAAIEDASLKNCGGFTIHRGKGGWIDPAGKAIKEEVAILMVSGTPASRRLLPSVGACLTTLQFPLSRESVVGHLCRFCDVRATSTLPPISTEKRSAITPEQKL